MQGFRIQLGARVLGTTGILLLALPGCGSDSKAGSPEASQPAGGSGGQAGSSSITSTGGKAGGVSTAPATNGPAISSAPAGWAPPTDCGGIGNTCANLSGCGAQSTCQVMGEVCIPKLETGATSLPSKSAERPYCAAYTCMTFEQASCFCTGPASKTVARCKSPADLAGLNDAPAGTTSVSGSSGSSGSGSTGTNSCAGQDCTTSGTCCTGLSCTAAGNDKKSCQKLCSSDTDCDSACCADSLGTGSKVCSAKRFCTSACKAESATCTPGTSTTPNDCCQGDCVPSSNPDFAGCRYHCAKASDCATGCCQLYSGSTEGFCSPAKYCSCLAVGQSCGGNNPDCCAGSHCTGDADTGFSCGKDCTTDADCPTKCCLPVSGVTYQVCYAAEYCQAPI